MMQIPMLVKFDILYHEPHRTRTPSVVGSTSSSEDSLVSLEQLATSGLRAVAWSSSAALSAGQPSAQQKVNNAYVRSRGIIQRLSHWFHCVIQLFYPADLQMRCLTHTQWAMKEVIKDQPQSAGV